MRVRPSYTTNTEACAEMGINIIDYAVADFYDRFSEKVSNKDAAELAMIPLNNLTGSRNLLVKLGIMVEHEDGTFSTTPYWKSFKEISLDPVDTPGDPWVEFCEVYNEKVVPYVNALRESGQTKLSLKDLGNKNDRMLLMNVLRMNPDLTMDDVFLVLYHKFQRWKSDDERYIYIRPSTLFKNSERFRQYLMEAKEYKMTVER